MRVFVPLCACVIGVFALLYGNYPFDGMILEESWNLYTNPQYPSDYTTSAKNTSLWMWLISRRGGSYLILLLINSLANTPVFVNVFCIGIQLVNLSLFGFIVWRLAGPTNLFPILIVALLYPFASGAHFWQIAILHHLALMFFLAAFALFLRIGWSAECSLRNLCCYGLPSLGFFWVSLSILEHAILTPVLFIYLALYNINGRSVLLRFQKLWSPAMALALCYLLVSLVFIGLFFFAGDSRISIRSATNSERFAQWASWAHVPRFVVASVVVGANAVLFFCEALLVNSIGYLGYPLLAVIDHASILMDEAKSWGLGIGMLALMVSYGFYVLRARPEKPPSPGADSVNFLIAVGLLWAFLAYLPFSSSFAYPRLIGQVADRVNTLALFGVSLCLGVFVDRLTTAALSERPIWRIATFVGCFLGTTVLLLNLYIQREYWVEGYLKERKIVMDVIDKIGQQPVNGRKPLVLLDRDQKIEFPRGRLNKALQEADVGRRLLQVAKVVLGRYFTEAGEMEVTSFHLQGIPLFGGGPVGGWVFNNYAKLLSVNPVVVYRMEPGVSLEEDADSFLLVGYSYMVGPEIRYSKHEFEPIVMVLDESFFQFRGMVGYRLRSRIGGISYTRRV